MREKIRVLLVDDHTIVRKGLRLILELHDRIDVCGEAGARTGGGATRCSACREPTRPQLSAARLRGRATGGSEAGRCDRSLRAGWP